MYTSDGVAQVLSDYLRRLCDAAIENAAASGRKTVLDRDLYPLVRPADRRADPEEPDR